MANPFDATMKHLVEAQPTEWLALAGVTAEHAEVIDADLSTLTAEADKVIRVDGTPPFLVHLEFQAG